MIALQLRAPAIDQCYLVRVKSSIVVHAAGAFVCTYQRVSLALQGQHTQQPRYAAAHRSQQARSSSLSSHAHPPLRPFTTSNHRNSSKPVARQTKKEEEERGAARRRVGSLREAEKWAVDGGATMGRESNGQ